MTHPKTYEEVSQLIDEDPTCIPTILKVIQDKFIDFVEAEKNKRESASRTSIQMLIAMVNPKNTLYGNLRVLTTIAYTQFPTGLNGHSPVEEKFWNHFLDVVFNSVRTQWIIEDDDMGEWAQRYVIPEISRKYHSG